jgi:hypothetical protein
MPTSISVWVMPALLSLALTGASGGDDVSPVQLLETLLSPQTSNEQWHSTADSFEKLPVETRIQTLFPEIAKGLPQGWSYAAYNCSNPDIDRGVQVWGRYCVANWLWCQALECGKKNPRVGTTLLELWSRPLSTSGKGALLAALDYSGWVPEAEDPVRALFRDSEADPYLRRQAALCLLHHFGSKYHAEIVGFAMYAPRDIRNVIFQYLVQPPHAQVSGIDPAVVRMGFWLLSDEIARNEEGFAHDGALHSHYGEFLLADHLGAYLNEKFTPDDKLPNYQGDQGREALWGQATENALGWWSKNKQKFAK